MNICALKYAHSTTCRVLVYWPFDIDFMFLLLYNPDGSENRKMGLSKQQMNGKGKKSFLPKCVLQTFSYLISN